MLNLETKHNDELSLEESDIPKSAFALPKAYNWWVSNREMAFLSVIMFSPDGSLLVTGSHSAYRSVDLIKVKNDVDFDTMYKSTPLRSMAIWDLGSRKVKYTLYTNYEISGTAFSDDSNYLATWSNGGLPSLWDLRSGKLLYEIKNVEVWEGYFSPDNLYFGSSGSMFNYITNVQSGELVSQFLIGPMETSGTTWLVEKQYSFPNLKKEEITKSLPEYTPKIFIGNFA